MGSGGMGSGGMGSGGMGSGGMGSGNEMGSGSGEGSTGVSDPSLAIDPADNRYISFAAESEFQPRKGAELRESIRTVSAANAVDAVAKRVAIRMRLKIDPSGLSRLITACGNADLLLEVYQVRVATDAAPATGSVSGGGMGGYGGMGGSGSGGGGGRPGMGGGMGMGGGSGGDGYGEGSSGEYGGGGYGAAPAAVEDASAEISIEIFGLIYLYNPDNIVSLGSDLAVEKIDASSNGNPAQALDPAVASPASSAPAVAAPSTGTENSVQPTEGEPSSSIPPAEKTPSGTVPPVTPPNGGRRGRHERPVAPHRQPRHADDTRHGRLRARRDHQVLEWQTIGRRCREGLARRGREALRSFTRSP